MEGLKNQTFKARCWATDVEVVGKLGAICKLTFNPSSELIVNRPDGTSFKTNKHGYHITIETEDKGRYLVDPDTVELVSDSKDILLLKDDTKEPTKWKCMKCGRDKFTSKQPHKCDTGFRKKNIDWMPIFHETTKFKDNEK